MARLVIGTDKTATTAAMVKGTTPVIDTLNVTPSTSAQTITAPSGTDGYSPVNVSAVTSSIDANIVAGNIKNGVSILGVEGTYTGSAPASYRAFQVDNGKLTNSTSTPWVPLPAGTTDVGDGCFYNAYGYTPSNILSGIIDLSSLTKVSGLNAFNGCFSSCTGITGVNFNNLTAITGDHAFSDAFSRSGLTSLSMPVLTSLSGGGFTCTAMCYNCTNLTTVDLHSLTAVTSVRNCENMFYGCTGLTSIDLSSLTALGANYAMSNIFHGCTSITSMIFPSLTTIPNYGVLDNSFSGCTNLTTLSFPSLTSTSFGTQTNQFNNMLQGVTGCTVHFPSNIQSKIGSWASVTGGFSGTNTTVLFDLPATNTLTGADTVTYTRNPKYDTATALAWKVGAYGTTNFTPAYYTSGTTDPAVSGTIYSDAACTTAVTTISSIA